MSRMWVQSLLSSHMLFTALFMFSFEGTAGRAARYSKHAGSVNKRWNLTSDPLAKTLAAPCLGLTGGPRLAAHLLNCTITIPRVETPHIEQRAQSLALDRQVRGKLSSHLEHAVPSGNDSASTTDSRYRSRYKSRYKIRYKSEPSRTAAQKTTGKGVDGAWPDYLNHCPESWWFGQPRRTMGGRRRGFGPGGAESQTLPCYRSL